VYLISHNYANLKQKAHSLPRNINNERCGIQSMNLLIYEVVPKLQFDELWNDWEPYASKSIW